MANDLLARAREQAERSDPAVRAPALMRIARVETSFDQERARKTFAQGLDETRRLSGRDREFLLEQARLVAAAVAPDLVREIPSAYDFSRPFSGEMLGKIMLEHEHGDAAYVYVMSYYDAASFPFGTVSALIHWFGDEERRLALMRHAIEAWRWTQNHRFVDPFIGLFQSAWNVLPRDEAREVAQAIVRRTLERPDWPIRGSFDQEQTVRITSGRVYTFFTLLDVLRQLDPPLAESLIGEHEELAAAVRRFPKGSESVREEAERKRSASPAGPTVRGHGMIGSPGDFPYMQALMQASEDGDFESAIEHALAQYREDAAPDSANQAPREFWPSTCRFRSILYRAGKQIGQDAAVYLDRIPDHDLRLFAQIELAAALAGLPELQGVQRGYVGRGDVPRRRAF